MLAWASFLPIGVAAVALLVAVRDIDRLRRGPPTPGRGWRLLRVGGVFLYLIAAAAGPLLVSAAGDHESGSFPWKGFATAQLVGMAGLLAAVVATGALWVRRAYPGLVTDVDAMGPISRRHRSGANRSPRR